MRLTTLLRLGALSLALFLGAAPSRADVIPRRLDGHKAEAIAVAFRPDGKVLASGGKDGTIILWDAATGKNIASWTAHKDEVAWLAFSPDGKTLASTSRHGTVCLWDPETKEKRATVTETGWPRFAFAPDSKTIAVSQYSRKLGAAPSTQFVDVQTGKTVAESPAYGLGLAYSADGKLLAVGHNGSAGLRIVELATEPGRKERIKHTFDQGAEALAFHPEGKVLAAGYYRHNAVKLWDVETGKLDTTIRTFGDVHAVVFSRDGKTLAFSQRGGLTCWDMGEKKKTDLRAPDILKQIAFHPDGQILAAAGQRAVWLLAVSGKDVAQVRKPKTEIPIVGHSGVVDLVVSPSGKALCWLYTSSPAVAWQRLDEESEVTTLSLGRKGDWNHGLAFDKDENLIVASFLDPERRPPMLPFPRPFSGPARRVRGETGFSPDRKIFAVGGSDVEFSRIDLKAKKLTSLKDPKATPTEPLPLDAVRMWGVASGKEEERLEGHTQAVLGVAHSPDGKMIASFSMEGKVRVWDLTTNKTTQKFRLDLGLPAVAGHGELTFVNNRILAGLYREVVTLWDVVAGKEIGRLEEPASAFARIAASPDGKLLAAAAGSGEIVVWEVATQKRLAAFCASDPRVRPRALLALAFSPDGKTLFSSGMDTTISVWDLEAILAPGERR